MPKSKPKKGPSGSANLEHAIPAPMVRIGLKERRASSAPLPVPGAVRARDMSKKNRDTNYRRQ